MEGLQVRRHSRRSSTAPLRAIDKTGETAPPRSVARVEAARNGKPHGGAFACSWSRSRARLTGWKPV